MANMSYCRFENTNRDLADCEKMIQIMIDEPMSSNTLGDEELFAAKKLATRCLNIVRMLAEVGGLQLQDDLSTSDLDEAVQQLNDTNENPDEDDQDDEDEDRDNDSK